MYSINENIGIQIKTNLYLFYAAHEMFTKLLKTLLNETLQTFLNEMFTDLF
jgi:hypothetical protein